MDRVYNALKSWLEHYWLEPDDATLDRLLHFAKTAMADAMPNIGNRLIDIVQRRIAGDGVRNSGQNFAPVTPSSNTSNSSSAFSFTSPARHRRVVSAEECPSVILPKNHGQMMAAAAESPGSVSIASTVILEYDPLEIARQLTLMESRIFNSIEPRELMNQEWARSKKNSMAVNVRMMSQISTQVKYCAYLSR
jgi:hypothetical protein